jgi:divalent metal cation (Fe/Co/Zn/Cd) transporter
LTAAAFAIIYGGIREITVPSATPARYTLVVLAGVLIIKELMYQHVASVGDSIDSAEVMSDA